MQVLQIRLDHAEERLGVLEAKLEGPRGSGSVRDRLHILEGESQASRVAAEALSLARSERRLAREERQAASTGWRDARLKAASVIVALIVGAFPYVAHFSGW